MLNPVTRVPVILAYSWNQTMREETRARSSTRCKDALCERLGDFGAPDERSLLFYDD